MSVDRSEPGSALPAVLFAGPHSGRNAAAVIAWTAAQRDGHRPEGGRRLWLVGALQRGVAALELARASTAVQERLVLEALPAGCPCCAPGLAFDATVARLLRRHRSAGSALEGLVLQLEPEGDPCQAVDQLVSRPTHLTGLTAAIAVLGGREAADLRRRSESAAGPAMSWPRYLTGIDQVWVEADAAAPEPESDPAGARRERLAPSLDGLVLPDLLRRGWSAVLAARQPEGFVRPAVAGSGWRVCQMLPMSEAPWQRAWPATRRFDRRRIPDWLDALRAAGAASLQLIARTERDWIGWSAGGEPGSIGWRRDSRIAFTLDGGRPPIGRQAASIAAPVAALLGQAPLLAD